MDETYPTGDTPDDVQLTDAEKAVLADRADAPDTSEAAPAVPDAAPEHPNHPEVVGQPDPAG